MPPVAQKKHHMFGKRYFQEQGNNTGKLWFCGIVSMYRITIFKEFFLHILLLILQVLPYLHTGALRCCLLLRLQIQLSMNIVNLDLKLSFLLALTTQWTLLAEIKCPKSNIVVVLILSGISQVHDFIIYFK